MVVGESAGGGERSEHSLRQTSAVCGDHNPKLKEALLSFWAGGRGTNQGCFNMHVWNSDSLE